MTANHTHSVSVTLTTIMIFFTTSEVWQGPSAVMLRFALLVQLAVPASLDAFVNSNKKLISFFLD